MNDLTFGATLLSCFAMLVAAATIEFTSVPERSGVAVSRAVPMTGQAAKTAAAKPEVPAPMQRFIIERNIPGAGKLTLDDHRGGAVKSNGVLREMGPDIQWLHSYVAGDKVYCIYHATSDALIREHAARSGFPANKITPVSMVVDPTTASPAR